jgi:site-specific DNA-methyltransferase (adenine-specific)
MVFKKPNKTGSVLHDTLAFENGDDTIGVSALNIDNNRVEANDDLAKNWNRKSSVSMIKDDKITYGKYNVVDLDKYAPTGRYPAQTFVDEQVAQALNLQSGDLIGGVGRANRNDIGGGNISFQGIGVITQNETKDIGGCSKILHKIKYEEHEHDLFIYEPKVNEGERNNGLDKFEEKPSASSEFRPNHMEKALQGENGNPYGRWKPLKNNHPTLKPIDLNAKVLKLFKTPNDQKICFPFAGSGSEILGGLQAGFSQWVACEINQDYVDIANARIKHYTNFEHVQLELF